MEWVASKSFMILDYMYKQEFVPLDKVKTVNPGIITSLLDRLRPEAVELLKEAKMIRPKSIDPDAEWSTPAEIPEPAKEKPAKKAEKEAAK